MTKKYYTSDEVEAALCIWEEILNCLGKYDNYYGARCYRIGTAELRKEALELAPKINRAYCSQTKNYDDPFDWEFIPAILGLIAEKLEPSDVLDVSEEQALQFAQQIVGE